MIEKDVAKLGLQIASNIPVNEVSMPANVVYNIASLSGMFDKEGMNVMTDREIFYEVLHDGTVVNENEANVGNCKCTKVTVNGNSREMCWHKGILGILSKEQTEKYCNANNTINEETVDERRIERIIEASDNCKYGNTFNDEAISDIKTRIKCMTEDLKSKGIDITEI